MKAAPRTARPPVSWAWAAQAALVLSLAPGARSAGYTIGPSAPAPRAEHAAAYDTVRSRLVVFGGGCGVLRNDTWEYDASSATWVPGAPAPAALTARSGHAMAFHAAPGIQRIVLFGGADATGPRDDTWEYDGNGWVAGPAAPAGLTPRQAHVVAFHGGATQRTVLFGGRDVSGRRNDTWEYDGAAWTPGGLPPPLLFARESAAMTYDARRDRIVLFGGSGIGGLLGDTWEYDGASWTLGAIAPPLLTPRQSHVIAFDARRDRTVLFGGNDSTGIPNLLADTWEYDGLTWTPGAPPAAGLTPRQAHVVAFDASRQRSVVFGGDDGTLVNDTWEYDGTSWTRSGPTLPSARERSSMAYDPSRQRSVLFGGRDPASITNDTWELDATGWSLGPAAPAALTPRQAHVVAFAGGGRVVLFGGNDGTRRNDTWVFDGTGWTAGGTAPPALTQRDGHAMAYDAPRARVVLFGGDDGVLRNDTWEYDAAGGAWTAGPPAPLLLTGRAKHGAAFDAFRSRTVVFGGFDGARRNDTWEYDGSTWRPGPAAPAGLTPRQAHVIAYDGARARVVLVGGDDGAPRNDSWEYDGSGWYPGTQAPAGLTPRQAHVVAFDSAQGRLVLFAGSDGCLLDDTWTLAGAAKSSFVAGAGLGDPNPNLVGIYDTTGQATVTFPAYAAGRWGTRAVPAALDRLLPLEILSGPGPGPALGPQVRGFRAAGTPVAKVNFYAFGTLRYGVNVASGDLDADGFGELAAAAGAGAIFGPHVRGFGYDAAAISPIAGASFFAYGSTAFGANVGSGDADGDGRADFVTGPGPGPAFAPQVRGFALAGAAVAPIPGLSFGAFSSYGHGVEIATGDVDDDDRAELLAAAGPGPALPARIRGFAHAGSRVTALPGFDATPYGTLYGARTGAGDVGAGAGADVVAGPGRDPAAPSQVRAYRYDGAALSPLAVSFEAFPGTAYGVNPTAGDL